MKATKIPTDYTLSDKEMKCLATYNERQRRQFLAIKAEMLGRHGVSRVCEVTGISRKTLHRGLCELDNDDNDTFPPGRIRAFGGGRTAILKAHPEYLDIFDEIVNSYTAGLPQDDSVVWLTVSVPQIIAMFKERGIDISRYVVNQMKKARGFKERSFVKALTLKDVKDRNAQFEKIERVRSECVSNGVPIFSIDTKKKEMVGNFKRQGTVSCKGQPKSYDHDFKTFSEGTVVPHGIYDVGANTGYLSLGTSHDTAEFVCDHFIEVWREHLQWVYPNAETICILCDGGGSNACSHHIVKQSLMRMAATLGINIIMLHYPPYCSKYNPIEHCMFGPISRSWSGAPLLSVEDARKRAENTVTKKGLSIIATINQRTYETKRPIKESYESEKSRRIVFDDELPKWNYLIRCS